MLLYSKMLENRRMNEITRSQINEMQTEISSLKAKGDLVQQRLSPAQRELLLASHKLVANKTFGWSRLFYDLESVLPAGVSASRIVVQNVYRDGDRVNAELDLTVLSRDYRVVMDMIVAMNNSGVFNAELRSQNLQASQRATYTEFTLKLFYRPPFGVNPQAGEMALNGAEQ